MLHFKLNNINRESFQCFVKCFFEKTGFIGANGAINEEKALAEIPIAKPEHRAAVNFMLLSQKNFSLNTFHLCFLDKRDFGEMQKFHQWKFM